MINPWVLLAIGAAWVASIGGAGYMAYGAGKDAVEAEIARDERVTILASEAARVTTAEVLAKMEVKNVTIRQQLETVVREKPVFLECRSGPESVRLLNSLPGVSSQASAPSHSELPASGSTR